ncbi:MAG: hypothetical protein KIT33_08240 [Candidatus Kapabacteria bacterium]|nr:hypothetical protein [Ignavibacteriota bacterium]MCW5884943.1 hypothetical protein [Candidatus Kapabacteria bacterium]
MTFHEFISNYDHEGTIVLLEGKRAVTEKDKVKLISLSKLLAMNSRHIKFRSGNASGADNYFSKGFSGKNSSRFEVIVPYHGHRSYDSAGFDIINIEDIPLTAESTLVVQSKENRRNLRIFDAYIAGERNSMAYKAAYLLRDTLKVIGHSPNIPPADFAIFYDDLLNPKSGGTGHTMVICERNKVPHIDQKTWFNWI